jgi:DsbC/DsbD-like thiol-disulfide interchange protein
MKMIAKTCTWQAGAGICFCLATLFLANADLVTAQDKDAPVKLAASASKIDKDGRQTITVTLEIGKNWHIYANPVGAESLAGTETAVKITGIQKLDKVDVTYPAGKKVTEDLVGKDITYLTYEGKVEISAVVKRAAGDVGPLDVSVTYNACNDVTKSCAPRAQVKLQVK